VAIIPANAALPFFKKSRLEMSAISKEKIKLLVIEVSEVKGVKGRYGLRPFGKLKDNTLSS
jgi:hypothetical protein